MTSIDASSDSLLIQNPGDSPAFTGRGRSIRCADGKVVEIAKDLLPLPNEHVIDAAHRAVIPGLHDHHIHLLATAAARTSIDAKDKSLSELLALLNAQPDADWLRVVNYHESLAGEPDRHQLDRWVLNQPLRVQHRTGQMWFLNTAAINLLELNADEFRTPSKQGPDRYSANGIQRDDEGNATGRLFREDDLLSRLLRDHSSPPDLTELSRELASFGVTGTTDTSYKNTATELALFKEKQATGEFLQRIRLMGSATLPPESDHLIETGELKILLDEAQLPELDELIARVEASHRQSRAVAIHCVTQIELAIAISVLNQTGCIGDRIEHGSVIPEPTLAQLRTLGISVVSQPGFIRARGDSYLNELDEGTLRALYRNRSLLANNIPLALSSDAPYGPLNPWLNMQTAVTRATAKKRICSADEALTPEQALLAYCGLQDQPGKPNTLCEGSRADLAILTAPWAHVREHLSTTTAWLTLRDGQVIHSA